MCFIEGVLNCLILYQPVRIKVSLEPAFLHCSSTNVREQFITEIGDICLNMHCATQPSFLLLLCSLVEATSLKMFSRDCWKWEMYKILIWSTIRLDRLKASGYKKSIRRYTQWPLACGVKTSEGGSFLRGVDEDRGKRPPARTAGWES